MKLTKIFGIVLSLHVAVILLVMFQPGCQTGKGERKEDASKQPEGNNSSTGFNAGLNEGTPSNPPEVATGGGRQPPTPPKPGELLVPVEPGSTPEKPTPLRPTDVAVYKVQRGDNLWAIAKKHNISVDRLLSVNQISKNATLNIGQEIFLPVSGTSTAKPVPVSTGAEVHVVQSGDTLSGIARTYGVSVSAIQDANNLRSTVIQIGQRLLVPGSSGVKVAPIEKAPLVQGIPGQVTHTVKLGETLIGIARSYGVAPKLLADMNSIEDPRDLRAGQVLIVNPAPITEEPPIPQPPGGGDDPEDLETIFKNAGEAPVIPLLPKNE